MKASFLLTHLGTQLFQGEDGAIRHGDPNSCPNNLELIRDDKGENFLRLPITSCTSELKTRDTPLMPVAITTHRPATTGQDLVTLSLDGLFLCARPDGTADFVSKDAFDWEMFAPMNFRPPVGDWRPSLPMGGTELLLDGLQTVIGSELNKINLSLNNPPGHFNGKPSVVWIHNETSDNYSWCRSTEVVSSVDAFVFVSNWQRQSFIDTYALPPQKCFMLRNYIDIDTNAPIRYWSSGSVWKFRCAYISAPYRGLDVLLDAWELLNPLNAELHIWSSRKLWGLGWEDNAYEEKLFERARHLKGCFYHGIAPNKIIRSALLDMHFLSYPSTFLETSCLAAIEAMSAGCRVIVPSLAALPETTAGFARTYPFVDDKIQHASLFASVLAEELEKPWQGNYPLSALQQTYCRSIYSKDQRALDWLQLIAHILG